MSRNKEVRELQFTSTQLVVVFVLVIALGAFIFILGVSVGKKQALEAQGPALTQEKPVETVAEKIKPPAKIQDKISGPTEEKKQTSPASKTSPSDIQKEIASFQAQQKTTPGAKPPATKTQESTTSKTRQTAQSKQATPEAASASKTAANLYYIQVAAATQQEEAMRLAETIRKLGFSAFVLSPLPGDRTPYYRVRVGGYKTEEERIQAAERLAQLLNKKASDFYFPPLNKS